MSTVDFVAVNAKGGQAEGGPLAAWLHDLKRPGVPLVPLLSEMDGPRGNPRIYYALTDTGIRVYGHRRGETHGEREVAVGVVSSRPQIETFLGPAKPLKAAAKAE